MARCQWVSDSTTNTPVCIATSIQDSPAACSDGSDGAIIAWEDARGGGGFRVYAQRLDANGKPLWKLNGVALAPSGGISQRYPILTSDGQGGAYVVWQDWRNSASLGIDLYAQHITNIGVLAWDTMGRAVATELADQTNPVITADGYGNAFVVWEDNNTSIQSSAPDLGMNKLTTSGVAWGSGGAVLTNQPSKQRRPSICEDGSGGFYAAWDNDNTTPTSITGQHVDGSGRLLWSTPYGNTIFQGSSSQPTQPNVKNVNLHRDGSQLLAAWEVTNPNSTSDGQDVYANRLLSDGTKVYYTAPPLTPNYPGNETNPVIFSDDSVETGNFPYAGFYVLFQASFGGPHLGTVRMFADGITQIPATNGTFASVTSTAYGMNGFRAVPCPPGSALVAWNDARYDSCVFAQRVDRLTKHYFPSASSLWGLAVSARASSKSVQVTLAPRTNGGIAAWTDYRNGNADIYAQLVFKDGTLPIELSSFNVISPRPGEADLSWQTASESACAGFEIERRQIGDGLDNNWTFVADFATSPALRALGTSNEGRHYAFVDRSISPGFYEYRLIDISLSGEKRAHEPKLVDASTSASVANAWSFGPSVPNPVQEGTSISILLPDAAVVDVLLTDPSGRVVSHPISGDLFSAGAQSITLSRDQLPSASGVYFASLIAYDPITGGMIWHAPPVRIAVLH
ncbi:MAG: hypothetical protein Q8922_10060 [Bacteroidota bacterium]|nr:hypothetical protein [Bacteroidota bacterium]MDP4232397.1 hypothetical protein [Bacteroidota bacterium]MDP4288268.1 hypothetical protein [Bacteroidota bacterium]